MLLSVPMEARVWSGVGWSEGSPGQKLQDLHQKLVDLKMDMQKLNDEAGGQLLFVSTKRTCILGFIALCIGVASESMCTKYWLTACSSWPRKKCG